MLNLVNFGLLLKAKQTPRFIPFSIRSEETHERIGSNVPIVQWWWKLDPMKMAAGLLQRLCLSTRDTRFRRSCIVNIVKVVKQESWPANKRRLCWLCLSRWRLLVNFFSCLITFYLMNILALHQTNWCRAANYQKLPRCSPTSLAESSLAHQMCTTWSTGWRRRTWWWTSRPGRRWWSSKGCRCLQRAWGSLDFGRIQEK